MSMVMVTTWGMSMVSVSSSLASWPWGPVPSTSAVLTTSPVSMSAWVGYSVAVQVPVSPGVRVAKAGGQVTVTGRGR